MSDIVLSSAVRNNLLALQDTAQLMDTTQNRLATGKKVNSALDNPTSFFTAAGLDNRASDLNNLLDSVGNAVQTLQAASTGITSLQKLVDSAKAIATQALQAPNAYTSKASLTSSSAGLNSTDLTAIIAGTGVNATTGTGTVSTLGFTSDAAATSTGTATIGADTAATTGAGSALTDTGNSNAAITGSTQLNNVAGGSGSLAAGDTITIDTGNGVKTLNVTAASTGASDANNIQANDTVTNLLSKLSALAGTSFSGSVSGGKITFGTTDNTLNFTLGGTAVTKLGLTAQTYKPTNSAVASSGSVTVQVGGGAATTIYFGTGTGQVSNRRDLLNQLNAVQGLSASVNSSNKLVLSNAASTDYKSSITLTGSADAAVTGLGFAIDSGNTNHVSTIKATNLLTQTGLSSLSGQSLTVGVGSQSTTITFGTGTGQVSTLSELSAAITNAGGTLNTDAGGKLSVSTSTANVAQSLTIGGSAASTLGINSGQFAGTGQSLSGKSLTVTTGTGTTQKSTTLTFGSSTGQVKSLDDLNNALSANGISVQASLDSTGKLTLTTTNDDARDTFTVNGTAAVQAFGAASAFTNVASSAPTFGGAGDPTRRDLATQFNGLLSQIDQLAQDSSFNGVNLLAGDDLSVTFNENGTSKLDIKGVKFDSQGLGLQATASDGSDFLDSNSINKVVSSLDGASTTLRSQSSAFGSNLGVVQTRQDFTKSLVNVLQTGSANLTLADTNEEAANSTALQTRQQLSIAALSLSNQSQQAVLRLLQ